MEKTAEMKRLELDVNSDPSLKAKLYKTVDRLAGEGQAKSSGELFEKAAAELGYQISTAELERFYAEMQEIGPDELEQAAGGYGDPGAIFNGTSCWKDYECLAIYKTKLTDDKGHDIECLTAWHCYLATLHTKVDEDKSDYEENCFTDYYCVFIDN